MASIRNMDSFLGSYSVPSFLKEEPTNFAKALSDWLQIQNNYYKNDKARMAIEDEEEERKKNKELEKKKLELGVTLDPDDLQGSIRKVIDFSKGEGDLNTSLNLMGRIYQMDKAEKKEREAAARKLTGLSKKEQEKLEKEAKDKKANGYMQQGVSLYGLSPEAVQYAATLAILDGDSPSARNIASFGKTLYGNANKNSSDTTSEVEKIKNFVKQNQAQQQAKVVDFNNAPQVPQNSKVRIGDTFIRQGKRYVRTLQGDVPLER